MSTELGEKALEEALKGGASYADIRLGRIMNEVLIVKNGAPEEVTLLYTSGFGVRVIADRAWGFAGSIDLTKNEIVKTVERAIKIAKASAMLKRKDVELAKEKVQQDRYHTPLKKDPFEIPLEEKLEVLMQAEKMLAEPSQLIKASHSYYRGYRENKVFMSTEGAEITQEITWCGGGIMAIAVKNGDMQLRSYPCSFGGNYATSGYEFFESLELIEHAKPLSQELLKLFEAEKCPSGKMDLILTADQLMLQVHESCGHPTELDRVLGTEADSAGTSFLTPEKLGNFRYGSEKVNIAADATVPGGLGTFGYDDEGTPSKKVYLVKEGLLVGYQSSRETAAELNLGESSGGMRADSLLTLPLIRMTNINLLPGDWKAEGIVEDTKNGILTTANKSWSIDDKRVNFQFGTEIAWKIKNGSKENIVKRPTYIGVTPEFWGSCDAISKDDWMMWGTPACGKGVPPQVMYVGHGCGTARFRNIQIGLI